MCKKRVIFFLNNFLMFLCIFERKRQRERERERNRVCVGEEERERETQNLKKTPGSELSAQSQMPGSNSGTVRS